MSEKALLNAMRKIPLYDTLDHYSKDQARHDLVSALTVAVVAIPQSMAYAVIAGVDPVYGLYTAILSTILSSMFGSSNHLIAGPTNAISLLVASSMRSFGGGENALEMLFFMTLMIGAIQILFGLIKLGKAINYVSHSVIVGFSAGAGVLIALGQLNQILGISIKNATQLSTMEKVWHVLTHLGETSAWSLGLGLLTIATILACRKINRNLPSYLIGIILPVICVVAFSLEQKGVKLTGAIPASLPPFRMVHFDLDTLRQVFSGALAIAIIGLVEAISIAKSIASTSRQKIDANQEFVGQGIANLVSSFFQCFAGSGSFTRSAVNYYSGAATRLAGIFSGGFVALVLLFLAPYAKFIPMPSLAGVIMVIAYNMVNREEMRKVSRVGKSDRTVLWITFAATVVMPDLDWAIYSGIIISIALYLRDTNRVPVKVLLPSQDSQNRFVEKEIGSVQSPVDILIIQIEGSLYFGSASDLAAKLESLVGKSRVVIVRMKQVLSVDVTSIDVIRGFIRDVKEAGAQVILCGVNTGLNAALLSADLIKEIGAENILMAESEIFASSAKALERASRMIAATS